MHSKITFNVQNFVDYSFKATSWAVTFASSELMYEHVNADTDANIRRWKTKKTNDHVIT